MKVLVISNAFPNGSEPTRGIFTYQIVKALQKKCDVEVIAPLPWVPPFPKNMGVSKYPHAKVPVKENLGNITVHHLRYLVIPRVFGSLHAMFMFFPLVRLVRKLDKVEKIDLINAHWIFPDGVAATWAAKKLAKPIVLTALGCDINLYSTMMLRRIQISKALRMANYITAVSNDLKSKIASLDIHVKRVKVIPNGVDLSLFSIIDKLDARKQLGISPNQSLILTVGSQDEVKGTRHLIDAFYMISEKVKPRPQLVCIGDGPLRASLISQVNDLGIADHVLFAGRKPHRDIPLWMSAADVFCLPSLREGHPNVVMEALSCGVPVVASNVGSIPEIINDSNGRICRIGDSIHLSQLLFEALNLCWNRASIRDKVKNDWRHCGNEYHKVYLEVLNT